MLSKRTTGVMGGNKLWVTGLDREKVSESALHAAFVPYGDLLQVEVSGKGYGFVIFELQADAEQARDNLHNGELFGRRISVQYARPVEGRTRAVWESTGEREEKK